MSLLSDLAAVPATVKLKGHELTVYPLTLGQMAAMMAKARRPGLIGNMLSANDLLADVTADEAAGMVVAALRDTSPDAMDGARALHPEDQLIILTAALNVTFPDPEEQKPGEQGAAEMPHSDER